MMRGILAVAMMAASTVCWSAPATQPVSGPAVAPPAANVAQGISPQTLADVQRTVILLGEAMERNDQEQLRGLLTGNPAGVEITLLGASVEQAAREADRTAREKLQATSRRPAAPEVSYPHTNYLRRVMARDCSFEGDDQVVTLRRMATKDTIHVARRTKDGWRIEPAPELAAFPPDLFRKKAAADIELYRRLKQRVEQGEIRSWAQYTQEKREGETPLPEPKPATRPS